MTIAVRILLALVVILPLVAGPALAQSALDQAKASGLVGERPDGMLGVVGPAPSEVRRMVDEINARRQGEYRQIAGRNGTSPDAVARVAGERLISRSAPGTFVMDASGKWRKK